MKLFMRKFKYSKVLKARPKVLQTLNFLYLKLLLTISDEFVDFSSFKRFQGLLKFYQKA